MRNTAKFELELPDIDDDGNFDFAALDYVAKPLDFDTLVRLHLLWSMFNREFQLFKKELQDERRMRDWN